MSAAIAVPMITVAAIAIPLVAYFNEKESSAEALQTLLDGADSAEVIGGLATKPHGDYLVPTDTPFDEFPLAEEQNECSDTQRAWLLDHDAVPISSYEDPLRLTLKNSATTGAALALENIRFEGRQTGSERFVYFQCVHRAAGGGSQVALVRPDGSGAVYSEYLAVYDRPPAEPGSPVTVNLSPGEVLELVLMRDYASTPQGTFEGRIVADTGDGDLVILGEPVTLLPLPHPDITLHISSAGLSCGRADQQGGSSSRLPCSGAEAMSLILESIDAEE